MEKEVEKFITENQDWYVEEGALVAGFEFSDFTVVQAVISEIMELMKEHDHHPDIIFSYKTIIIRTVTHDAGDSITEKDFAIADAISALV